MEVNMIFGSVYVTVMLIVCCVTLVLAAAIYVLQGLSFYTVAKRRGIEKPWLAWIPVAEVWTLGCISDQYRYITQGTDPKLRTKLLWSTIVYEALMIPYNIMEAVTELTVDMTVADLLAVVYILLVIPMLIFGITAIVYQYKALFDYYRSCVTDKATLYLMLSIFVPFASAILVFLVRNQDLGMQPTTREEPPASPAT